MGFFEKFKAGFIRFMQGRNGPDQLGSAAIWTALGLCLLSMFTGWAVLSALCLVLWGYGVFRLFSRNTAKRYAENQAYLSARDKALSRARQAVAPVKGRKQYCYLVCPQCKARLRLPRGVGEVNVHCRQCGHTFPAKG